MNFPTAIT